MTNLVPRLFTSEVKSPLQTGFGRPLFPAQKLSALLPNSSSTILDTISVKVMPALFSKPVAPKALSRNLLLDFKNGTTIVRLSRWKAATRVNFRAGRKSAQEPGFLAKRSATQRRHIAANRAWNPWSLPSWLNKETYIKKIKPALSGVTQTEIASTLGVSWPYAKAIHSGQRIPHRRHWSALSKLAGVSAG